MAERVEGLLWKGFRSEHFKGKRIYRFSVCNRGPLDNIEWCMSDQADGYFCATTRLPDGSFQDKIKFFYFTDRNTALHFKLKFYKPPRA